MKKIVYEEIDAETDAIFDLAYKIGHFKKPLNSVRNARPKSNSDSD